MPNNLKTEDPPFPAYPGLDPDYPYVEDYLNTGRLRDPKTGMFVARCPFYPEHPAPCREAIWSHFGPSRNRGIVVWLVGGGVHVRRSPRAA